MKPRSLVLIAFTALLAGCAVLSTRSASAPPPRYVVSELGAVGDGTTVNTKALQSAIDRCAADGGGVVVIPKGTFLSGALYFKQGVNLLVEKDAVLKSTATMADFPPIYTRWEGIERYWTSAFLNFVGVKIPGASPGAFTETIPSPSVLCATPDNSPRRPAARHMPRSHFRCRAALPC